VKLGEEILRRERAEFEEKGGHGGLADIAEAQQQLDQFKLNLVSATSEVITTERQLRNILGLAPSDNRRIVPCTAPSETLVHPDWDKCLATMLGSQPDVVEQTHALSMARVKAIFEVDNPTLPAEQRDASRQALEKQREFLQQITNQTTHSLARFFLEVDANYKQFKIAQSLRETSQKRLDKQRTFYEEGRITVDRLLDAVSQYANAIAEEAQYRAMYNTSIAALDEAMGTILSADGVTIETRPRREAQDAQLAPASFDAAPVKIQTPPASTIYKLRAKLGLVKILDIELEVCPNPK
jgi:outer membrane protein TolC